MNTESRGIMICSRTSFFAGMLFIASELNRNLWETDTKPVQRLMHRWPLLRGQKKCFRVLGVVVLNLGPDSTPGQQVPSNRYGDRVRALDSASVLVQDTKSQEPSNLYIQGRQTITSPHFVLIVFQVILLQFVCWGVPCGTCLLCSLVYEKEPLLMIGLQNSLGSWPSSPPPGWKFRTEQYKSTKEGRRALLGGLIASTCWWGMRRHHVGKRL